MNSEQIYSTTGGGSGQLSFDSLRELLGGKRNGCGFVCCCPVHEDKSPSLSVGIGQDGRLLLKCFAGCDFKDVARAVDEIAGGRAVRPTYSNAPVPDDAKKRRSIERIWDESLLVSDSDPASVYLREVRGLPLESIPSDLRFHAELAYWEQGGDGKPVKIGEYPAMVAAVRDLDGRLVTVHRTYLTNGGEKISGRAAKKLMPACRSIAGCSIRLSGVKDVLVVAEGIETALAASILTDYPAWAGVSSAGLRAMEIPETVQEVIIAADADEAGLTAAQGLAQRLRRENVKVKVSKREQGDWADEFDGVDD